MYALTYWAYEGEEVVRRHERLHWERLKGSRQEEATLDWKEDGISVGMEGDKTHGWRCLGIRWYLSWKGGWKVEFSAWKCFHINKFNLRM